MVYCWYWKPLHTTVSLLIFIQQSWYSTNWEAPSHCWELPKKKKEATDRNIVAGLIVFFGEPLYILHELYWFCYTYVWTEPMPTTFLFFSFHIILFPKNPLPLLFHFFFTYCLTCLFIYTFVVKYLYVKLKELLFTMFIYYYFHP
jgi:hypothetical protein